VPRPWVSSFRARSRRGKEELVPTPSAVAIEVVGSTRHGVYPSAARSWSEGLCLPSASEGGESSRWRSESSRKQPRQTHTARTLAHPNSRLHGACPSATEQHSCTPPREPEAAVNFVDPCRAGAANIHAREAQGEEPRAASVCKNHVKRNHDILREDRKLKKTSRNDWLRTPR